MFIKFRERILMNLAVDADAGLVVVVIDEPLVASGSIAGHRRQLPRRQHKCV